MKHDNDIQQMMVGLRSKRRFRSVNHDKLARLFECSELNIPESWPVGAIDPQKLSDSTASIPCKRNALAYIPKAALWASAAAGIAAALLFLLLYPVAFRGDSRTGTAHSVSGDVRVVSGGIERTLAAGDTVSHGDVLIVGQNSSADIGFKNSLQMRILAGSRITLRSLSMAERGRKFDAMVTSGGCVIRVSPLVAGESVSVHTPTSMGVVRGTVFGVRIADSGAVRYEVFEGRVRVQRCLPAGSTIVPAAAAVLNRYFERHAVEISGLQACGIGPDAKPLAGVNEGNVRNAIAEISIPGLLPDSGGELQMRNEAEQLIKAAVAQDGEKTVAGEPNNGNLKPQVPGSGRSASDTVNLIYVPELDYILSVGDHTITAFKFEETRWTLTLEGPISSLPVLEGTSLFIPSVNGTVTMADVHTGAKQWAVHLKGELTRNVRIALDGYGIYCVTAPGTLYKISRNGEVLWQSAIGGAASATPVLTERLVFVPVSGGRLFGVDASSGVKVVTVRIGASIGTIGAKKEHIFIVTDAGKLYCYNYKSDEMLWNFSINDAITGEMVIENNSIYLFGRKGHLYCISIAGALIWDRDIGSPILKMPSHDDSCFYVPARETLYVIDKTTGNITWSLLVPRIMSGNVAVSKGHIYFGIEKNGLASLKK